MAELHAAVDFAAFLGKPRPSKAKPVEPVSDPDADLQAFLNSQKIEKPKPAVIELA